MSRTAKGRAAKGRAVREPAVEYQVRSMAEVFWLAFKSLSTDDKNAFLDRLLNDPEFYDEIADAVTAIEARDEPSRPYEEFVEELRREGRL